MMKNPGQLLEYCNGKKFIKYNNQPLLISKGLVMLHQIDNDFKPITAKNGKQRITFKNVAVFNLEVKNGSFKGIGMVD